MKRLLTLLPLLFASPALAEGCDTAQHQRIADLTAQAVAGEITPEALGQQTNDIVSLCTNDRVAMGQIMAMMARAGIARDFDPIRVQEMIHAFRTANGITHQMEHAFEPYPLAGGDWTQADERDAYWDLMLAMSTDYLVHDVHADIYTAGITERVGCQLYPAEEASALATQALDGADGGDFLVRMNYLGTSCDGDDHATSGQVALYFANHEHARETDPAYAGLTAGDIRAGLQRFLPQHLAGRDSSDLFPADEVTRLMAF